ncbi:MAG: hypothetical protein KIT09_34425 [Bryobacteraceae bacterium]|nr:hypothetical protein [Bryobacteraceae bacterium]
MNRRIETPVAWFIFNRPDTATRVFEALRVPRPSTLLVVADGPRPGHPEDPVRCAAARAILDRVDWDCRLLTNFAADNLGLKRRVESGLTWVFSLVEEAIILEDDTVPDATFFPYCADLLARHRDDERIMAVNGGSFIADHYPAPYSYHFTRYPLIWGWATWRRAWRQYDPAMRQWPSLRARQWLSAILESPAAARFWSYSFQRNFETMTSWDYAWTLSCWLRGGLCITPGVNLVTNIGFRPDATHTSDADSRFAGMPVSPMPFPLRHPPRVERDAQADLLTEQAAFSGEHFLKPMFAAARAHIRSRHGA